MNFKLLSLFMRHCQVFTFVLFCSSVHIVWELSKYSPCTTRIISSNSYLIRITTCKVLYFEVCLWVNQCNKGSLTVNSLKLFHHMPGTMLDVEIHLWAKLMESVMRFSLIGRQTSKQPVSSSVLWGGGPRWGQWRKVLQRKSPLNWDLKDK